MEVSHSNNGSCLKKKYTLILMNETAILQCKPADTPIKGGIREKSPPPSQGQRLLGKLIYQTPTRSSKFQTCNNQLSKRSAIFPPIPSYASKTTCGRHQPAVKFSVS